jgi:hypothetical protein
MNEETAKRIQAFGELHPDFHSKAMRTWRTIWKNESMRHMQSMGTGKPIVVPL